MKLSFQEKQELEDIYHSFKEDEKIQRMKQVPMHLGSNCFVHCFKVAKLAIKRALRHKKVDLKLVLLGSILHDYYLYDWRTDKSKKKRHGYDHPFIASKNAEEDFQIPKEVKKIIESHMWPMNIKNFPNTKEARIVSLADKALALKESLTSKAYKAKREEKYYSSIELLFDK